MKRILFITTSSLNPYNYTGDTQRANNIIYSLRKKNIVDTASLDNKEKNHKKRFHNKYHQNYIFKKNNFFLKIFFSLKALFSLKPIQFGFFFSKQLKEFVVQNHKNYHTIICHLNRSSQYLPEKFSGIKILEMTDIESNNYSQRIEFLKKYNPLFFLYLIEYILIKRFEKYCINIFDKIILVSKNDISKNTEYLLKKVKIIGMGVNIKEKLFRFNIKNNKIIFIGSMNYLPNKDACLYFAKKILPKLKSNIKFYIIGKINIFNKISFLFLKKVRLLGPKKKLDSYIRGSICGISNLRIATGVQTKILTYGSYGLPVICSLKSINGIPTFKNNQEILIYKNDQDFIRKINILNSDKISDKISKNIYKKTQSLSWNKTLTKYSQLV